MADATIKSRLEEIPQSFRKIRKIIGTNTNVPSRSASGFITPQQVEVERLEVKEKPGAGLRLPFG